ncbi:MFS transporter [Pseudomonas oligotrophica]|uniref:MFS transporter n=1 Tax=Pseudomonas oligotrophica TaxID=2912055 RepID=UPI001F1F663A|nr:MFS transporter [Pseudomonas oligotrophica]MCF7202370.1 MFS transporter [Pseudomonas oligotrophica]
MFGLTQAFGALYLASLLLQAGSTLLMTYLALRLTADGAAAFWGGALMAANALGMVLGGRVGQWMIQRVGHIRTYGASAGLVCVGVLLHGYGESLGLWLLLRALVGMAMMCQLIVLESWLNECAGSEQRGKALGLYMVSVYVGMILGQLALGFHPGLGIQVLLSVVIAFALSQVPVALTRSVHPAPLQSEAVDLRIFLRRIPQSLVTVLSAGMLNGGFFGLAAIYASRQGLSPSEVGQFMALVIGAGLLAQLPLGWLSDRLPRAALIRAIAVLLALASLPLALYQGLPFVTLLLFGAGGGFLQFCLYPLGVALANDNVEANLRVSLAGLLLATFGIGACIGPLVAGFLMERFGTPSLYYFSSACAALLALAVSQRRVHGTHLQEDAPLQHQATPNGIACATLAAVVEAHLPPSEQAEAGGRKPPGEPAPGYPGLAD